MSPTEILAELEAHLIGLDEAIELSGYFDLIDLYEAAAAKEENEWPDIPQPELRRA